MVLGGVGDWGGAREEGWWWWVRVDLREEEQGEGEGEDEIDGVVGEEHGGGVWWVGFFCWMRRDGFAWDGRRYGR